MGFNITILKNFIIPSLRAKNYRWKRIKRCNNYDKYHTTYHPLCKDLLKRCNSGYLTKKELAFCKRIFKDKIKLTSPQDLDHILSYLLKKNSETEISVVVSETEEIKILLLGEYPHVHVPKNFSYYWLFIVKFCVFPEILTTFPLVANYLPFNNYLNRLKSLKTKNRIKKVILPPIPVNKVYYLRESIQKQSIKSQSYPNTLT